MALTDSARRAGPPAGGFSLLLVEDNPHHAEIVRRRLERAADAPVRLAHAATLAEALRRLGEGGVDAVLLDLILPDSPIHETLPAILEAFPAVPVVVLTSLDDIEFAASTVQQGAQDYLVKSQLTGELLFRSVRYAVERKKAEDILRRYAADLERSNEDFKQFAHTVAHEVKNPMSVVSGCLELLRLDADKLDESARDLVAEALAGVRGMAQLVDELLTFASVERREEGFVAVDLESLFFQTYVALRPEVRATGARVTHDPLPVVRGDAVQLRHVLQNLIGNALKYRGPRTPQVHVSAEPDDDPRGGRRWRVCVRDNGIGIPPEHHDRVFDMFFRVHAAAAGGSGPAGTGIGLAFCRRVVEQHGGRIWVESEPGRGSAFYLVLPAADPASADDAAGRDGEPVPAAVA